MIGTTATHTVRIDVQMLFNKARAWRHKVLMRTGAYGMGAMRNQIRSAGTLKSQVKETKFRTVIVGSSVLYVPWQGYVVDRATGRRVTAKQAERARQLLPRIPRGTGAGKPPRSRSGLLKRHIRFAVDDRSGSVVIGAEPFSKQPTMMGRVSVPELLDKGGIELVNRKAAIYEPRPFVRTVMSPTYNKMQTFIEKTRF